MERYVIDGGPHTGKTTTLNELNLLGYAVVPEAARVIIAEQQAREHGILPWTDYARFQDMVLERTLELESRVDAGIVFCDRGIVAQVAYCRHGNIALPPALEARLRERRYAGVFILEPLPSYEKDAERREDRETGLRLHKLIEEEYQNAGYPIVRVPVMLPKERAEYIARCAAGQNTMRQSA